MREKRAVWWKMFSHQRAAIESLSDEDAGKGLKAAFRYFDGEEVEPKDIYGGAFTAFCVMRPYIDEATQEYAARVQRGKDSQT